MASIARVVAVTYPHHIAQALTHRTTFGQ